MKKKTEYKTFCVVMTIEASKQLDKVVKQLTDAGYYRANRSLALRMAIKHLAEDKGWTPPESY